MNFNGNVARIEAVDRRLAALHEAGHLVLARHFGMSDPSAEVWRAAEISDPLEDKLWLGRTYIGDRSSHVSQSELTTLAVAGAVAELCWQHGSDYSWLDDELWNEPLVMSSSDWKLASCDPGKPTQELLDAIVTVEKLFNPDTGPLWASVAIELRRLILEARLNAELDAAA